MVNFFKISIASLLIFTGSAFYFQSSTTAGILSNNFGSDKTQSIPGIRSSSSSKMEESSSTTKFSWIPTKSLQKDPEALCQSIPQMAKDTDFATAVIQAWKEEEAEMKANHGENISSETRQIQYQDVTDGATLYGHLIRTQSPATTTTDNNKKQKVPGVLLFHTGAGPHDISLLWKADLLACNTQIFPKGCVILVVDILGDDIGWGWSADRTNYNRARSVVLQQDDESSGKRPLLQSRIRAALTALQEAASDEVDMNSLAALGWCLGGHSILELGRMKVPGIKAMITFHGVFDGLPAPPDNDSVPPVQQQESGVSDILICHGQLDPFVPQSNLKPALETLRHFGHTVRLLELEGAKHGFSNPAQDFNPNQAFAYHDGAAKVSWSETTKLLQKIFA